MLLLNISGNISPGNMPKWLSDMLNGDMNQHQSNNDRKDSTKTLRDANFCSTRFSRYKEAALCIESMMYIWFDEKEGIYDITQDQFDLNAVLDYGDFMLFYCPYEDEHADLFEVIDIVHIDGVNHRNAKRMSYNGTFAHIVRKILNGERGFTAQKAEKEALTRIPD